MREQGGVGHEIAETKSLFVRWHVYTVMKFFLHSLCLIMSS